MWRLNFEPKKYIAITYMCMLREKKDLNLECLYVWWWCSVCVVHNSCAWNIISRKKTKNGHREMRLGREKDTRKKARKEENKTHPMLRDSVLTAESSPGMLWNLSMYRKLVVFVLNPICFSVYFFFFLVR